MSATPRKDAFQQAARCILHPITLGSMFLLFLNDYILRVYTPSWFTGKLGDFTWLFFFPYLLTAIIVWGLPKGWIQKNTPILISIGFTVMLFTLGKVWPAFLQRLHALMEWFLPWDVRGVIDPTDLAALVVLPGTFWLWKRCKQPKMEQAQWSFSKKIAVLVSLTMAMVLTVGSQIEYIYGARCAVLYEDLVYINAGSIYQIRQGGSWSMNVNRLYTAESIFVEESCELQYSPYDTQMVATIMDPREENIQYRIYQNQKIERSTDSGKTWKTDYIFEPWTQAQIKYNRKESGCSSYDEIGPFDAVFDAHYNNLILAMGCRGILVRNNITDKYSYKPIGNFWYTNLGKEELLFDVLGYQGLKTVILAGSLSTFTFHLKVSKSKKLVVTLFILSLLIFILDILTFLPTLNFPPFDILGMLLYIISLLPVSILLIGMIVIKQIQPGYAQWLMLISGFLCSSTFLTCFILWGHNIIPEFLISSAIASIVSIVLTFTCHLIYKKTNQKTPI